MSKPTTPAQRAKRERRRRVRSDLTRQLVTRIRAADDGYTVVAWEPDRGAIVVLHAHDGLWRVRLAVTPVGVTQ